MVEKNVPLGPVELTTFALETSKPVGNVICSVPLPGQLSDVTKLMSTLPAAPAVSEAGTTLGLPSVPVPKRTWAVRPHVPRPVALNVPARLRISEPGLPTPAVPVNEPEPVPPPPPTRLTVNVPVT